MSEIRSNPNCTITNQPTVVALLDGRVRGGEITLEDLALAALPSKLLDRKAAAQRRDGHGALGRVANLVHGIGLEPRVGRGGGRRRGAVEGGTLPERRPVPGRNGVL